MIEASGSEKQKLYQKIHDLEDELEIVSGQLR